MTDSPAARGRLGTALVAAQLGLMGLLAWLAGPPFLRGQAPAGAWLLATASGLLAAWALAHNRPSNFNIRPAPRAGGHLVHDGPYRWIRHPMYTSILACGAAGAWATGSAAAWLAVLALAAVLATKAFYEERWMLQAHPGYAEYRRRTRRFLPFVL